MKQIANKPLLNLFWDRGTDTDHHIPVDFSDTAPKDKTQIFVLSPEVALAAEKLVRSDTFRLPALDDIRMPYEHTAIEIPLSAEIQKIRRESSAGYDGLEPIDWVGAHVWADPQSRSLVCTPYWKFTQGRLQYSGFSFTFGERAAPPYVMLNTRNSTDGAIETGIALSEAIKLGFKKAKLPEAMLTERLVNGDEEIHVHVRESAVELPLLVFACSMLLNCKSGLARTQVAARTVNFSAYGAKRRKAMSASAYTLVHLSALEKVSGDGTVSSHVGMAAHYVRGHFKQRKSGVYWWSSFVRGNGEPRRREAYVVKE